MGRKDKDLNPFVVCASDPIGKKKARKKKKKKRSKHKKEKRDDPDSSDNSSLSSGVEDGALAKDKTDLKIFQEMFLERDTSKVVAEASVYDRFSDNESEEDDERQGKVRLGPGLRRAEDMSKKKKKKKKKKSKKKKEDKKRKKRKKKKENKSKDKKRRREKTKKSSGSSSSDSSSSDSDADDEKSVPRLINLPLAFKTVDLLLGIAKSMKDELPGMLGHIDEGEELDISGIPNEEIREKLSVFFEAMLFRKGPEGGWQKSYNTPPLLPLFSPNIERYIFKPQPKPRRRLDKPKTSSPKNDATADSQGSGDEHVQKSSAAHTHKKKSVAGPAMPSFQQLEEAKKMAEAKAWENTNDSDDDNEEAEEEDLGPTLPGQNSKEKELALENLRRIREIGLERKKLEALKPKRENWMTVLPEERSIGGSNPLEQKGRTFSMKGVKKRGDTSEWTMTPAERRQKAAEKLLEETHGSTSSSSSKKRKRSLARKQPLRMKEERVEANESIQKKKKKTKKQLQEQEQQRESLLSLHQRERQKNNSKKKKQIGGTSGFSFRGMREDRQFNKKEAKNMKNAGKDLMMSFGPGSLYKSGL